MKICFLLHQGNMYSGGQGIYLHHVTREMAALGNEVHVIGGPPYPELAEGVQLHKVQNYSVYRLLETGRLFFFGRDPRSFFHPLNFYELATSRFGMFSVMAAFANRLCPPPNALGRIDLVTAVAVDDGVGEDTQADPRH